MTDIDTEPAPPPESEPMHMQQIQEMTVAQRMWRRQDAFEALLRIFEQDNAMALYSNRVLLQHAQVKNADEQLAAYIEDRGKKLVAIFEELDALKTGHEPDAE